MAKRSGQVKATEVHMLKLGIAMQVNGGELKARQVAEEIIETLTEAGFTNIFYDEAAVAIDGPLRDVDGGMVPHCRPVTDSTPKVSE